jgi:O-antigen/teichoic acid export membrane protein
LRPVPPSLRKNVLLAFGGNLIYVAAQWALLVVLTRLGTPDDVGVFALGLAISAPVMLFASMNLRAALVTDAQGEFQLRDYLSLRIVASSLAYAVVLVIAVARRSPLEVTLVIALIGLSKLVESIADILHGFLQQHERMGAVARSLTLKACLMVAAFALTFASTKSVALAAGGLVVSWTIVVAVYDVPVTVAVARDVGASVRDLVPRFDPATLRRLARQTFPLGLTAALLSLVTNIPRYVLESYEGPAALGVFANLTYLVVAGALVVRAVGQAGSPRLARYWATNELPKFTRLVARMLGLVLVFGSLCIVGALLFGPWLLGIVFGASYRDHAGILVGVVAAGTLTWLSSILGYAAGATRLFARFVVPYAALVGVTLVVSMVLIPRWRIDGAVIALVVTACASLAAPTFILSTAFRQRRRTE